MYISKKKLHASLSNEYLLFIIIVLIAFCLLSASFCCYSYYLYEKEIKDLLSKITKTISFNLVNMLQENEDILKFFGSKIVNNVDPANINGIAALLVSSVNLNIKSMTKSYICWVNSYGKLTVSGKIGILKNNFSDIRERKYFLSAKENPWTLQLAEPSTSFIGKNPILPTAMGVKDKNGKFLGYLILGLRIDHINQYIQKIANIEKANYIIFDENFNHIVASDPQQNTEILTNKKQLATFVSTNIANNHDGVLSIPLDLNNIRYSYLNKIPDYPLFVLVGHNASLYKQDFLYKVSTKLVEFLFIGIFCLILLYFFRKKIISPITNLSELAYSISNGNCNINIPKQNSIEMSRLAKGLLLVIKYIRRTELYKQKLEFSNQIAKDSDYAKAEFIKKMHYEFGNYFKELLVYSDLTNQYLNNNHNVNNNQIIKYSQKIQELAMRINNKVSNILELSYFDLNTIVEKAIKINMKMSFLKEIFIFTNLQPNIPNIYADELRIKQILISLIHQSIENSPKNSEISITSNTCLQNNGASWFEITIIDQSFGLDEHILTEIEGKFGENTGTSILEFTKMKIEFIEKIVSMHKGKLNIENKLHNGRKVQLLFPLLSSEDYISKNDVVYFLNKKKLTTPK